MASAAYTKNWRHHNPENVTRHAREQGRRDDVLKAIADSKKVKNENKTTPEPSLF
jgi:predicted nucleic acid-binding Zn ribbon protein